MNHGLGQSPVRGKVKIGEDYLARPQQRPLRLQGFFDFDDQFCPLENLLAAIDQFGSLFGVLFIEQPRA